MRHALPALLRRVVFLLALLVPLATRPALAADLNVYESRSYNIHTNLSPDEAREFGVHMDLIFREYTDRFSVLRGNERDKKNLYLLRTRQNYVDTLAGFGINGSNSGGMYFFGPRGSGLATWTEGLTRDQVFSTLQHEGFHQFADSKLGRDLPLWVNEGLAEYFGSAIIVDGKVRLGIVEADRLEQIRAALASNNALGFDELLNITSPRWHANMADRVRGPLQYDQSWSMVHFLVHGDGGRYRKAFESYLLEVSRGRGHDEAFKKSFGTADTAPFAKRWIDFIAEAEPDAYSTALKRIQFLGTGLGYLRASGADMPADLDTLKAALQQRGFKIGYTTEAGEHVIDAANDGLYAYETRKGESVPFELVAPAAEGLPPSIKASQLRPTVTLTWEKDDEGNPRPTLEYR